MADIFTTAERFSQYTEGHVMPWRLHNGFAIIMVKYIFQRFFFLTDYNIKRVINSVMCKIKFKENYLEYIESCLFINSM